LHLSSDICIWWWWCDCVSHYPVAERIGDLYGVIGFFALSIVIGAVQKFRRKDLLDLSVFIAAPLVYGWLFVSISGVVTILAAFVSQH
jgi:hypothetical protein